MKPGVDLGFSSFPQGLEILVFEGLDHVCASGSCFSQYVSHLTTCVNKEATEARNGALSEDHGSEAPGAFWGGSCGGEHAGPPPQARLPALVEVMAVTQPHQLEQLRREGDAAAKAPPA